MYAIVEIAGKQFKVKENATIKVPFLSTSKVGDAVEFERVVLVDNGSEVTVGRPVLESAKVEATVVDHGREKKIIVFKKKRRKGYKIKRGHRQHFTKIQIGNIAV